jgi:molecular chaperone GrpE
LTPETIEAVLTDFRSWLQQLPAPDLAVGTAVPAVAHGTAVTAVPTADTEEAVDLHTLLGQFIALRHEVNLQTRAVRTQQEQNTETLRQLTRALDDLERANEAAEQASGQARDEQLRPLLKVLVDVADALGLARREMQRLQQTIWASLDQLPALVEPDKPPEPSPPVRARAGLWARWFGSASRQAEPTTARSEEAPFPPPPERRQVVEELAKSVRQLLASLITGYTMSLQRIERALRQQGLEAMDCTGRPFDPEAMEVLETVADSDRPAGEVIEEVRPGYLWHGRVFRYAQVRVAKS